MKKILGGAIAAIAIALVIATTSGLTHTIAGTPVANTSEVSLYAAEVEAQEAATRQQVELAYLSTLQTEARNSLQEHFDNNATTYPAPIIVSRVTLIRTSDSTFEGTATMTAGGGSAHEIPIHVTADDRNVMWRIDPGALLPLFIN